VIDFKAQLNVILRQYYLSPYASC